MTPLGNKVTLAMDNLPVEGAMCHIAESMQKVFIDQRGDLTGVRKIL